MCASAGAAFATPQTGQTRRVNAPSVRTPTNEPAMQQVGLTPIDSTPRLPQGSGCSCLSTRSARSSSTARAARARRTKSSSPLREPDSAFVGLDVIAGPQTMVNVTSPTGLVEIQALTGADIPGEIIEWAAANAPASIKGAAK